LEPPYKQFELIEIYISKVPDYKEKFKNLIENINDFLYYNHLPALLECMKKILNSTIYKDLVSIQTQVNKENSIFFTEKMEEERKLLDGIMKKILEKIWTAYVPEDTIKYFNFDIYSDEIDNIYDGAITRLSELKNKTFSKYNSSAEDIYQNETEKFNLLLNERYFSSLISYTNSFANNLKDALNNDENDDIKITITDIENAEEYFDYMEVDKIKQNIINAYQNYLDNTIDKILFQKIQPFLDAYRFNYLDIVTEYRNILEFNYSSFIEYVTNYYNKLQDSISSLIDDYKDQLYSSLRYDYYVLNYEDIENYFKSLINDIQSKLSLQIKYTEFQNLIQNKINEKIKERKNDFLNFLYLNYNGTEFEIKLEESNYKTIDYIINEMVKIDDENKINILNNITSNYDHNRLINDLKIAFQNFNKTIVQNFTEKTLNFLKDLKEKESHGFKFYLLSLKMSTVKINDRVCYDLRGLSNSEAVILDDNYKNKYLSYLEKKELIEKNCKFNGGLDEENCIYDLSEIEPVENKSIIEIFKNCFSKHELPLSKKLLYEFSILENPEDFDINSIFNKIKKKLDKLNSFEELVTKYLFKNLNINSYHKNLENMNILNITEIKNQDTNNTQSYNDYIRELLLKLFKNLYSDYFKKGMI